MIALTTIATFLSIVCGFGGGHPPPPPNPLSEIVDGDALATAGLGLFNRRWEVKDGLGPHFNANSCATCHPMGGSGEREHNVQLISLEENSRVTQDDRLGLVCGTGGLLTSPDAPSFILPKRATRASYAAWRDQWLGLTSQHADPKRRAQMEARKRKAFDRRRPIAPLPTRFNHRVLLSERNTPALFGISLINQIELATLKEIEARQAARKDGISGRVPMVDRKQPGRFGWRGQIATLSDFVALACSAELGLQNRGADEITKRAHADAEIDIKPLQIVQLTQFLEALPAPQRVPYDDPKTENLARLGRSLIHTIHCDRCHVADVGPAQGVFSDFLLHDLGKMLSDPVPAAPKIEVIGFETVASGYSGSFTREITEMADTNIRQEWRTPPLWGVADSAPYLHDGRAGTLREAILLHGGEASQSRRQFTRLSRQNQNAVILFLNSLRSPVASTK